MLTAQSATEFSRYFSAACSFASENVILSSRSRKLTLLANTNDKGIRILVPNASTTEDFSLAIPAAKSAMVFKSLNYGSFTLKPDSPIVINQAGSRFKINCFAGKSDMFPGMVMQPSISIKYSDFVSAVSRVIGVATGDGADLARQNADGSNGSVFFDWERSSLTLATFDGTRLAAYTVAAACRDESLENYSNIVPSKFISLMSSLANAVKESIHIGFSANAVRFRFGPYVAVSTLTIGKFIPWRKLVTDPQYSVSVSALALMSAVEQATTLCAADSRGITLRMGGSRINLSGHSSEAGSSEASISCPDAIEPYSITFSSPALINGLRPISSDTPQLTFSHNSVSEIRSGNYIYRLCNLVEN